LNDFTVALAQQMFFWGRDVVQTDHLLIEAGFEKRPSLGLQGTSCYRLPWRQGFIELHGACAGWFPNPGADVVGFLFIRADKRCYTHRLVEAVIPGSYDYAQLVSRDLRQGLAAARRFAAWLCEYESWIQQRMGMAYRCSCWEMYSRLTASRAWLEMDLAPQWLNRFAAGDPKLERARVFKVKRRAKGGLG